MGVVGGGAAVENVLDMSVELDKFVVAVKFSHQYGDFQGSFLRKGTLESGNHRELTWLIAELCSRLSISILEPVYTLG